jgi:hypothetical protein
MLESGDLWIADKGATITSPNMQRAESSNVKVLFK